MAFAPTLTALADQTPVPRVKVVFTSLNSSTSFINVYRLSEGRTWKVQGGVQLTAAGGVGLQDLEAPFNVPSVYSAEQFDISGNSLGFTDTASVTLASTQHCIHQPLNPSLAIYPKFLTGTAPTITRKTPGSLTYTEGSSVGTWIGGQSQGVAGVNLEIYVNNTADADELKSMFGNYTTDMPAVLCVRPATGIRLPKTFFAAMAQRDEKDLSIHRGGTDIQISVVADEAQPPYRGLLTPLLRREDIDAAFTTRGARAAAYATRLARDTDYSKAGLAGP